MKQRQPMEGESNDVTDGGGSKENRVTKNQASSLSTSRLPW